MSVEDIEDNKRAETSDHESELRSYLLRSDGDCCPRYDICYCRLSGRLCPCEIMKRIGELLDSGQSTASDYNFMQLVACCRVADLVDKIADRCLKRGKIKFPPVPFSFISLFDEQLPVEVRLVPLTWCHGAIWCLEDGWVIYLNLNDTPAMRRLTLFHEAFHILTRCRSMLPREQGVVKRGLFYEFLAESFSYRLLMPMKWVKDLWLQTCNIDKMAKIFDVPSLAMYIRLQYLHLL